MAVKNAWSTNQIENEKNNVPKTTALLHGHIAGSFNGGMNRTVHYAPIMAGQKIRRYHFNKNIQMLTPLTPAYQKLYITFRTYFVPNVAVWKNYYKFIAQKGGNTIEKIAEMPNFGGKQYPSMATDQGNTYVSVVNTQVFRDSFVADYLPRIGYNRTFSQPYESESDGNYYKLPPISALPLRGRILIYNELERNKEYDEELNTYEDFDEVTSGEWQYYIPVWSNSDKWQMRARRPDSYYTNYRTEIQGLEGAMPNGANLENNFMNFAEWQAKIDLARQNAENAQKTDWEIFAEIRGSQTLTEGRPVQIGEVTHELNYSAITQTSYNNAEGIQEKFQVMGQQGAYSYTNIDIDLFGYQDFKEDGYIHVIATVWAESVFSSGIDRQLLNVKAEDLYRPEKINEKFDVIYEAEVDNSAISTDTSLNMKPLGYKRKFSEIFKLPNIVKGDMLPEPIYVEQINGAPIADSLIEPNDTYQFFENSIRYQKVLTASGDIYNYKKKIWKDYTDLLINKNQAIENAVNINSYSTNEEDIRVTGQNQIFYVGYVTMETELPVDPSIQNNYTKWGEE